MTVAIDEATIATIHAAVRTGDATVIARLRDAGATILAKSGRVVLAITMAPAARSSATTCASTDGR